MRKILPFNQGWQFRKDGETSWQTVDLPHTWNALDGQDGGDNYYQGIGWYQKTFTAPDAAQVFIRFGAASKMASVFCNGQFVGEHRGGFSAFTMDLTPYLHSGENELTVKVDNHADLPVYPAQADFTFFGGLYRQVELLIFADKAHFNVTEYGADSLLLTPDVETGTVQASVLCDGGDRLTLTVKDPNGTVVAQEETSVTGQKTTLCLTVSDVQLWDGTQNPCLYTATATLYKDGTPIDVLTDSFGFRRYAVTADKGFFLNGRSYPLHGVCRHQDRENMGWGITQKEHLEDMAMIREIGANTIRLAHYQHDPFFYTLCDREGMVIWAEIPFISLYIPDPAADENLLSQMRELILQNYNHPSICFWGVANEIGIGGESEAMFHIVHRLHELCKQLDPSCLTGIANVGMTPTSSQLFRLTDVTAYNEYKGWYEGTVEDHGAFCDERHGQIPDIPMAISEYGAEAVLRWHSPAPKVKDYTEEYQAIVHEKAYHALQERPYIWATWLWNMFDFAVDVRNEGGVQGRNNKGLVTFDRKQKKQAFYFYKACWSKEPFVYICGERYLKHTAAPMTVKVYSNAAQVTLLLNGHKLGTVQGGPVFLFPNVVLDRPVNELMAVTDTDCRHSLIWECVAAEPEEYTLKETKCYSENVAQWFSHLIPPTDVQIREGYLSIDDPLEEVYRYPEGYQIIQELAVKPLQLDHADLADRMIQGGALSFSSIWNHINKYLPDEAYTLINARLSRIKKTQ